MNKKFYFLLLIIVIACPILIFYLSDLSSVPDLIGTPKLYGDNAEIQHAFERSVNEDEEDILLKYPSEGDYKSAYILYDIDSDGVKEVLVFYSLKSDETTIHINVLDYLNGKWVSKSDTTGYGSEVISVDFSDLDNDGQKEIVICWTLYESKTNKILTVQKCVKNKKITAMKTLANENYSCMKLVDMDNDSQKEIFISTLDSSTETVKAYARLLKMQGSKITAVGDVNLDGSISSYSSIKVQGKSNNSPAMIFLDAYKGENQMITEVVYWDSSIKNLKAPLLDPEKLTNTVTLRSTSIASMDIDGDGIIEIPTPYKSAAMSGLTSESGEKIKVGITQWSCVSNNALQAKSNSLVNYNDFYILLLDQRYINNIVAYDDLKQRTLTVYSYSDATGVLGDALFSIKTVAFSDWTENPTDGYSLLKRNDSMVYAYKIMPAGESLGVLSDTLVKSIKIIS